MSMGLEQLEKDVKIIKEKLESKNKDDTSK